MLPFTLTNSNYSTKKSQYVPFTTHEPIFPNNEDSYYTANNDNNEYTYNNEYEDNDLPELMFPYSTETPPTKVITFMPIEPNEEDEAETEVRFDEKWNVAAQDNNVGEGDSHAPGPSGGGQGPSNHQQEDVIDKPSRTPSGTMVLVIGIILGAFVAMLLIVIIVLRYRTGVDRSGMIKCEDSVGTAPGGMHGPPGQNAGPSGAPRYQFAHPNDYGELGVAAGGGNCETERETATTALMEGGGPRGPGPGRGVPGPSGNGFFNNNCNNLAVAAHAASHNGGDRSRLFRKSNGAKPVREWYV